MSSRHDEEKSCKEGVHERAWDEEADQEATDDNQGVVETSDVTEPVEDALDVACVTDTLVAEKHQQTERSLLVQLFVQEVELGLEEVNICEVELSRIEKRLVALEIGLCQCQAFRLGEVRVEV